MNGFLRSRRGCGYDSDSAFGHAFMRIVGYSPRACRHDMSIGSDG